MVKLYDMNYKIASYLGKICFLIVIYSIEKGHGWTWDCVNEMCIRSKEAKHFAPGSFQTLDLCRLSCGSHGSLWPRPTGLVNLTNETEVIHPEVIEFEINPEKEAPHNFTQLVKGMCNIFIKDLRTMCGEVCGGNVTDLLIVKIYVNNTDTSLNWFTNESYSLKVEKTGFAIVASIQAETAFGARHGLQTLSQLMTVSSYLSIGFITIMKKAFITDAPVYPHRGLLIDTGRSFLNVDMIKRTLDGMAHSKLNVLHWHATDAQSFPLNLPTIPAMAIYGAYSKEKTYSINDIREIILYGQNRGVRIIMEIGSPGNAASGWQWGPKGGRGNLSVCMDQMPAPDSCKLKPCGMLNPANPDTFKVLGLIFKDLLKILPKGEIFHLGGAESPLPCWNKTEEVFDYMKSKNITRSHRDFWQFWSDFHKKVKQELDTLSGNENPSILWHSSLSDTRRTHRYIDKTKFVLQHFTPFSDKVPEVQVLLGKGYRLIISTINKWSLEKGFMKGETYSTWDVVYDNKIPPPNQGVYGGEVCMWGEPADGSSIEAKLWPRTAAFAERVWSDPSNRTAEVIYRLSQQRRRLVLLGIKAGAILPEWCHYNEGMCAERQYI